MAMTEQNKENLLLLLEQMENKALLSKRGKNSSSFNERRGELGLPATGKISNRFGQSRSETNAKWNGLFIEAKRGTPVRAVHDGTVIFSDWFRGFGLLIIVSHGKGYLSLYAHNETLRKKSGDAVSTDEFIATVGSSGGQNKTGLYFEIRVSGKPSDPINWCRSGEDRAA
jgi:septal ring factor EnvC (AmiA/AmiB activator)